MQMHPSLIDDACESEASKKQKLQLKILMACLEGNFKMT